jgi:PAS domain S-box-containing protein
MADVSRDARMPRASQALRAGLMTCVAFPLAVGDDCVGVVEFFSRGVHEPNGEVSAMFATVGGQLAQYLERSRRQQDESIRLHAQMDRTRGFLDAAAALIVVLDGDGRVLLANTRACAAIGLAEAEIMGQDWFALAVPRGGRPAARTAFQQVLAGEAGRLGHRLPASGGQRRAVDWQASPLDGDGGVLLLGQTEAVAERAAIAAAS